MKRCPECRRDYYDDSLLYCLDDGRALLEGPASGDEPATAILSEPSSAGGQPASEAATRPQIHTTDAAPRSGFSDDSERHGLFSDRAAKPLAALIIATVLLIGGYIGYRYVSSTMSRQIESIAVMPFINDSGNPDVEYLSDGMTETLISSLSHLPNLSVKPRSSVFRYKGKDADARTIGEELNVQAVLNGRVVQRGDQLTLSLELVDVGRDVVIWSEQYNRKQADLISLQTEIARDVSSKLKTKLSGSEEQSLAKTYTTNPQAYQLYLRGRYYWNKRTAENIRKAMEQFQQAADTDPNYALAYAGLADCYAVLGDYTGAPEADTIPQAQAFAKRALELDGSLVEAQTSLAYTHQLLWQWDEAEKGFKRAIELDPNYPTARHWYSLLLNETGHFDEAAVQAKRGHELDPLSPIISYNVAINHLLAGDVNAAIEQSKRTIDLDPNFPRAHQSLGLAYLKLNRSDEALAELKRALDLSPNDRQALRDLAYGYAVTKDRNSALAVLGELKSNYEKGKAFAIDIAAVYAGLGDKDEAFAWLEKAFETRTGRLARIGYHTQYESLRDDPRYADLRRRMGLTQ